MNSLEIKRQGLVTEMESILAKAKDEQGNKRSLNAEEKTKFNSLKVEAENLAERISADNFINENQHKETKQVENSNESKRFDLAKVLRNAVQGKAQTGFEAEQIEATRKAFESAGYTPVGNEIFVPASAIYQRATVTTSSASNWLVTNQAPELSLVKTPVLYQRMGVQVYDNLSNGSFQVPNLADIKAAFATEDSAAADITLTPNKLTLSPRFLPAHATFSRQMLSSTSEAVQQAISDAFVYAIDKAIDKELFAKISGLTASITGNCDTYAKILQLKATLLQQDNLVFLSSQRGQSYWMSKEKTTSGTVGNFVWGGTVGNDQVINYPAFASPQVPDGLVGLFDPKQAAIGFWGGLILTVDNISAMKSGNISIQFARMADVGIINSAGFAISKNGSYL